MNTEEKSVFEILDSHKRELLHLDSSYTSYRKISKILMQKGVYIAPPSLKLWFKRYKMKKNA